MAKPRTNADTIEYWAKSILDREPAPSIQVNSIIVERDVVYSFGHHYPMGVIERDSRGKVKRVILNCDYYPVRGFANTPGDQSDVGYNARHYANLANVPIVEMMLSAYKTNGMVQVRPDPKDPEPEAHPEYEVPSFFTATDPGPEPVDEHPEECIAGDRYGVSKYEKCLMSVRDMREREWECPDVHFNENTYARRDLKVFGHAQQVLAYIDIVLDSDKAHDIFWVKTWKTYWTEYGKESYQHITGAKYEQCPHCAEFDHRHKTWHAKMHGGYPPWKSGRRHRRIRGWEEFCELVLRYEPDDLPETLDGSWDMRPGIEGWKAACKEDAKRITAARKERKEWEKRNMVPLSRVPTKRWGIPDLDPDGFVKRKHSEQWKREHRAELRERAERERMQNIRDFCQANRPQVFPGPRGAPLAAIFPRTSEAFAPSLVLIKGNVHNRDKEDILLHASQKGNRIEFVKTRELTEAVGYIKNE